MDGASSDALERARRVRLMIFDVDGVLTDGRLWYGPGGEELKAFHSFDGHGMKMLAKSGVATALLSGRSSRAASLRAAELGVAHVLQGIENKLAAFEALLARLGLQAAAAGFMGDELVDLPVLRRCGFACAPREAPELVRRHAHYRTEAAAGAGAVREVCELIMQAQGTLDEVRAPYLQ
ncbi:MAG TPA: phenylphosphate carboxylase subunit delta [Burkholderiales bacterium]|nr:phenylphosphate carboxylase subunit delta [Burkholderiales bacterium]